jgi:prophage regulatory protein
MQLKNPQHDRVIREAERREITGVPPSSWYPLMDKGLAPRPISIGERSVGWMLSELVEWVEARKAARDAKAAA